MTGLFFGGGTTGGFGILLLPGGPNMYPMVRRPPRATGGHRWPGAASAVSPSGLDRD